MEDNHHDIARLLPLTDIEAVEAELARRSLREFVRQIWPVLEPGREFIPNWHLDAICDHLEAVARRDIRRLIINIPPRCCKSTLVSVAFPTWLWTFKPHEQLLFSSYAQSLSVRDSLKCRRVIQSDYYQRRWGSTFQITSDQSTKVRFDNDKSGYRLSTSVDGALTGEGGDVICLDDPNNSKDIESEAVREGTNDWYASAMSTRLNNPKTGAYILIAQRLHERDLTGYILSTEGKKWDHLVLPMEFEKEPLWPLRSSLGFKDPRKEEGELLWPSRFGADEVNDLKRALGAYGASSQLQQRPSPAGGGLIKREWFKLWPAEKPIPRLDYVLQSYDTAFTERTTGDPSACTTWGVFKPGPDHPSCLILLDCWAEHLSYPDLRRRAVEEYNHLYGPDPGVKPHMVLIEAKSSGMGLIKDLQRAGVPVMPYNPFRQDKVARVHQVLPLLENGRVYLPESLERPKQPRDWCEMLLKECVFFPKAAHDDLVDTMTQALLLLHDTQHVTIDEQPPDPDYDPMPVVNPYAL